MKNKLNRLIHKIMLTATASLIGGNVSANATSLPVTLPQGNSDKQIDIAQKNQIIKGVYKIKRNGDAQLIASHRSHSSHRSHRSHRSSSGYTAPRTKRSTGGGSSTSRSTKSSRGSTSTPISKTGSGSGYSTSTPLVESNVKPTQNHVLHLGDRVIKNVNIDRGNDVTELVDILILLGYDINRNKLDIDAQNRALYSPVLEKAVIEFKSKNGLPSTGVVDKVTVQKLKSQQK